MVKNKYEKGAVFERKLVNDAKAEGQIAFRSAGSHSPVDVVNIDVKRKIIRFIQAKTGSSSMTKKEKQKFEEMSDEYIVLFQVISNGRGNKSR